jgi:hypothetical protein
MMPDAETAAAAAAATPAKDDSKKRERSPAKEEAKKSKKVRCVYLLPVRRGLFANATSCRNVAPLSLSFTLTPRRPESTGISNVSRTPLNPQPWTRWIERRRLCVHARPFAVVSVTLPNTNAVPVWFACRRSLRRRRRRRRWSRARRTPTQTR